MGVCEPRNVRAFAELYVSLGWSVIPLPIGSKIPVIKWKPFQTRHPTVQELDAWFLDKDSNIAIVTGAVSGVFCLDIDSPQAMRKYLAHEDGYGLGDQLTPLSKTNKGWHVLFTYEEGLRNFQGRPDLGYDVRGEGGYFVAPPSVHEKGHTYYWEIEPCALAPLPAWLRPKPEYASSHPAARTVTFAPRGDFKPKEEYYAPKGEGARNMSLAQLAGHLFRERLDEPTVLKICLAWNDRNDPPLPDKEVETTVRSIARADAGRGHYRGLGNVGR